MKKIFVKIWRNFFGKSSGITQKEIESLGFTKNPIVWDADEEELTATYYIKKNLQGKEYHFELTVNVKWNVFTLVKLNKGTRCHPVFSAYRLKNINELEFMMNGSDNFTRCWC